MVRPERDSIGTQYPVEVDETFVGDCTKGEGYGVLHKAIVVGAVEVLLRLLDVACQKRKKTLYAGRLRLRLAPNRSAKTLMGFVQENVVKGAVVLTEGWDGYAGLANLRYVHAFMVLKGHNEKTDAHLPMIDSAFSNLKTWLLGTHHGVSQRHLHPYLNEYVFRFNRRIYPLIAFNSILVIPARASVPTYETLYSGEWTYPR